MRVRVSHLTASLLAGTAVADPATTSVSTKKTRKIARKQARKEIDEVVPGMIPVPASATTQRGDDAIELPASTPTTILSTQITTASRSAGRRDAVAARRHARGQPGREGYLLDPGIYKVALLCTRLAGDVQARQGSLMAWSG